MEKIEWNRLEADLLAKEMPLVEMRENVGINEMTEKELALVLWQVAQRAAEIGWTFKELVEI